MRHLLFAAALVLAACDTAPTSTIYAPRLDGGQVDAGAEDAATADSGPRLSPEQCLEETFACRREGGEPCRAQRAACGGEPGSVRAAYCDELARACGSALYARCDECRCGSCDPAGCADGEASAACQRVARDEVVACNTLCYGAAPVDMTEEDNRLRCAHDELGDRCGCCARWYVGEAACSADARGRLIEFVSTGTVSCG